MRGKHSKLLIFTDLDGTLLDHHSYDWRPAQPALQKIQRHRIPWMINSSKTRPEIEWWRRQLNNFHPFAVENGGAVFIPKNYFDPAAEYPPNARTDRLEMHLLGPPYVQLRKVLQDLRREKGFRLKGFGDMDLAEVIRYTGLSEQQARMARDRLCSEPFLWEDSPERLAIFRRLVEQKGLRILQGGRFYHLVGRTDKGKALQFLKRKFEQTWPELEFVTMALGDSQNDLDMLQAANLPVLVQRPDGRYAPHPPLPALYLAPGIGPHGWREAVLHFLPRFTG